MSNINQKNIIKSYLLFDFSFSKILKFKEKRFLMQKKILKKYQTSLITVSLNIPGFNKNKYLYSFFFQYIVKNKIFIFFQKKKININIIKTYQIKDIIGDYLIIVLDIIQRKQLIELKQQILFLENKEPILILVDIDVIDNKHQKIERTFLKQKPRICYLCSKPAKLCAKNKTHILIDLIDFIDSKIINFLFYNY
ncbi:citrate lyase holo-[acyl-carrier protein] synthase [Candidatus Phytoplasma prunorum]|uniref:citrate lyase holo-[acyl-carrier protein] synthase n=1 Tax=Candidatus Phytoplasma prunorum TaxID=47565 RepID=UPI002FF12855